jgi:hypothetical protein
MQGVVRAEGSFFISGACPSSFDVSYREPACVHKGAPGHSTHVLTAGPTWRRTWTGTPRPAASAA